MSENKIQADIVKWFHNTYPEYRGMLFEVNNSTDKGASRKAMGLVKGVSDLVMCLPNGTFVGIEIKENGTRHNVQHLREQLDWLINVVNYGGIGFFCFSLEEFQVFIEDPYNFPVNNSLDYIDTLTKNATSKTVKLDYGKLSSLSRRQ